MKVKEIEKELLIKCADKNLSYILTHFGFINNSGLSKGEVEVLHELTNKLIEKDSAIVIDNKVFSPYKSEWNGSFVLAGIKIYNLLK